MRGELIIQNIKAWRDGDKLSVYDLRVWTKTPGRILYYFITSAEKKRDAQYELLVDCAVSNSRYSTDKYVSDIIKCLCVCRGGESGACKHIVAALRVLNELCKSNLTVKNFLEDWNKERTRDNSTVVAPTTLEGCPVSLGARISTQTLKRYWDLFHLLGTVRCPKKNKTE
jgi:hypothetical protein